MNTLPQSITKVTDIIPVEKLSNPFPVGNYYKALKEFLYVAIPISLAISIAVMSGLLLYPVLWQGTVLAFSIGIFGALFLLLLYDAYVREQHQVELSTTDHQFITNAIVQLVNHIEITQYNVNKGGILNTGASNVALPNVPASIDTSQENVRYDLALKIAEIGITSWNHNKGVRPKPKPISAEVITEQLHIGREAWMEALGFLNEAGVLFKPESLSWRPLVTSIEDAKKLLDQKMTDMGYFVSRSNNKATWMK